MRSRQNLESQARRVLELLRGYTHRQEWYATDHQFVTDLLAEWDQQTEALSQRAESAERRYQQAMELNKHYERRLIGTGWGAYLKFLLGVTPWPSR